MIGTDVIDLSSDSCLTHDLSKPAGEEWAKRHLHPEEWDWIRQQSDIRTSFWLTFAAKEAAYKLGTKIGLTAVYGDYKAYVVDLTNSVVTHLVSQTLLFLIDVRVDNDRVSATVVADARFRYETQVFLIESNDPSFEVEERLLTSLPRGYAVGYCASGPYLLHGGQKSDTKWVSLSHNFRYAQFALAWHP